MCFCVLEVRAVPISVFCRFGPFLGRGRPQDLAERMLFEMPYANQDYFSSGGPGRAGILTWVLGGSLAGFLFAAIWLRIGLRG